MGMPNVFSLYPRTVHCLVVVVMLRSMVVVLCPVVVMLDVWPVMLLPRVDGCSASDAAVHVNHVHPHVVLRNHQMEEAKPAQVPGPIPDSRVRFRINAAAATGDEARQASHAILCPHVSDETVLAPFVPKLLLVTVASDQQIQTVSLVEVLVEARIVTAWKVRHNDLPMSS